MIKYTKLEELLLSENFKVDNRDFAYNDLLLTRFWKEKRNEILFRDKSRCNICNSKPSIIEKLKNGDFVAFNIIEDTKGYITSDMDSQLSVSDINNISLRFIYTVNPYRMHIHHHYYNLDQFPWQYENKALVCWCDKCHFSFHDKNKVPVYNYEKEMKVEMNVTPCTRCKGSGFLLEYSYFKDGVCFRCMGARYEELINYAKK